MSQGAMNMTPQIGDKMIDKKLKILGAIIGTIGLCLIFYRDWLLAIGIFLCIWGDNICKIYPIKKKIQELKDQHVQ
jgi:energy-converting hydrogenase Eha subunit E